ncbi:saccharopine dehydrogenase NADP-binding domain-containing protein [Nocardia huaxiensis]|uniref:Saccharopine dehydrogenase NADP-binding domain-containing protein n=1 Tax=Nocardia huaxiensis TaxID=2755382 RepID=A0A7D6YZF1_9NOCA|nr:saccharopine dehydrogenase NADP-binding domain-containing protein [Nocardia huaxiensis]QLY28286.1 saccharopine dehydrogenase NADP-binding domain-containing protein [Nocardia huaxiensis]
MTGTQDRELDIVVFGATGFTGGLTTEYLAEHAPAGLRVGLAGRNPAKLAEVRTRLGGRAGAWPLLVADTTDPESLAALARRTKVVITTVGPYTEYGMPLVQACVEAGTDYCDLTGEPQFARRSADAFHKQATDTGARIVHSCGFDSIPSDLSVHALYEQAVADGAGELTDTTLVLRSLFGGASGGTLASGFAAAREMTIDPDVARIMADPYALSPQRAQEPERGAVRDGHATRASAIDPSLRRGWATTFFMGPYNTRIVRRSNAMRDWAYGREFRYREMQLLPLGPLSPVVSTAVATGINVTLGLLPALRLVPTSVVDLARRLMPLRPGMGPTRAMRERGFFRLETFTTTTTGRRYSVRFAMQGDPGYAATSCMLGESGITLALGAGLSPHGGVLTPAVAMGTALTERLRAAGATIEILRTP